jgi:hypothetical protein
LNDESEKSTTKEARKRRGRKALFDFEKGQQTLLALITRTMMTIAMAVI